MQGAPSSQQGSQQPNKPRDELHPAISGAIGVASSLATNGVLYPMDLIKVRLQAKAAGELIERSRFRALRGVVFNTFKEGGLRAFYVGLVPGLIGPAAAWGSYMVIYKWAQQNPFLSNMLGLSPTSSVANFLAGMQAGVGMTLVTNPIFVIKTRMQTAPAELRYKGFLVGMQDLIKQEGIRGMYRGLLPALPLTCHAALHWTIFEWMKQQFRSLHENNQMNSVETVIAASGSKIITSAITYPLHVMKTCLQSYKAKDGASLLEMIVNIHRTNGLRGYYSGFLPHLARTVPNTTVTMFFIESLTQLVLAYK